MAGTARLERHGAVEVRRFPYFPERWEDVADGAILENVRARHSRWLQVPSLLVNETLALRRTVATLRPDLVHVHWLVPQGVAALAGVPHRVPIVVTTLGGDLYALNDPVSTALKRAVCRRAAAMTAQNRDMCDRLVALGADPSTTRCLPLGADLRGIRSVARDTEREHGLVVFVGRLDEKKGVDVLLRALDHLPADLSYKVEIVGDGPQRARLESLAAGKPVTFLGARPRAEVARALGRAAVVVIPSIAAASGDREGLPLVLLEAMGAGRAIVASSLEGIRDVIDDTRTGLLAPPGDPATLARAMTAILTDPDRGDALGRAASEAVEEYAAPTVAKTFAALFDDILSAPTEQARRT